MKNYGFIILSFFYVMAQAQANDDFSDGDFTQGPVWSGSADRFIINASYQLQLNNSSAGSSYLSTAFMAASLDNMEWQVYVKQAFSPSGNNYGRVYLVSDKQDLSAPLNGYYLQFGEAGANDAIELFQQTGTTAISVCRAANGAIATSFAVRVSVTRDTMGLWTLRVDYTGGLNFITDATGIDQKHTNSSFFGVFCAYTSSNATKFYYDDFLAGHPPGDTLPPAIDSVEVTSSLGLSLHFSEPLEPASSTAAANYSANNNLGSPETATPLADGRTVELHFKESFLNGVQNLLSVSGVKDLAGNSMNDVQIPFMFLQTSTLHPKDLVFTEILADPLPQIGLPTAEFVEIYNRSEDPIDLSGWTLSDGSSSAAFSSQIILPGQYRVVTSSSVIALFGAYDNVIGIAGFPTLNNEADTLTMKNAAGLTMDSVNYSLKGYHDPAGADGGRSLELIDPDNPCGEEENWTVSEDPSGGTPGKQNSVFASKPDHTGPMLLSVVPGQLNTLLLIFDEKLEATAPAGGSFSLTPPIPISRSYFSDRSMRQIRLELNTPLLMRQSYTLKVAGVRDCNENPIQEEFSELDFALPETADSSDILINEILFNPRPIGVDFIEVYNNSPKYINLKNWKFGNVENNSLKNIKSITSTDLIVAPREYRVFTADPVALKNNYLGGQERNFMTAELPGLPDDEGSVALVNEQGKVIDYFLYSKDFHSDLIQDDEGVSLERISFSSSTNNRQNWKSASSQAGFATPGYINSNAYPEHSVAAGNITIDPEVFIPGSGVMDFAKINYAFDQPGYMANIRILDQQGHLIKVVAANETLGFEGFFRWDGERDDGSKTRIGYYAVWVEVFDVSGMVRTFRKRVVVATR